MNNKVSKVLFICLVSILMCMLCGCSTNTDIKCDTDGKGVVTYRLAIDKNSVEDSEYTNFETLEDFAACLASKIDETTGLEVTTDRVSSTTEDYICISFKYNTIDEYEKNIDRVISKYNMLSVGDDFDNIIGYDSTKEDYKYELEALEEYMKDNNIDIDVNNRNVRKFIKIISNYIGRDGEFYDYEFRSKEDSEFYDVRIVEQDGIKMLRVNTIAVSYIGMYIRKLADKYNDELFNNKYIVESAYAKRGIEAKEVFKMTLNNLDFATTVKKLLDEKGTSINGYSMNDFTAVMTVKLFTEDYARRFNDEYNMASMQYEENKSDDEIELELNIEEELYKERDTFYNVTFGNNTVSMSRDEFFDRIDSDGHVAIPEESNGNSDIKEHNNTFAEGLDETPVSGDDFRMVSLMIMAGIALMTAGMVVISRMRR